MFKRFTLFYMDLLQDKHLKVTESKLGKVLVDHIIESDNEIFADLKKRILSDEFDKDNAFESMRKLNPAIFIKEKHSTTPII